MHQLVGSFFNRHAVEDLRPLRLLVDIWFQFYFTPLTGVLFTFPSRYLFTIGRQVVFRLTGWSRLIQTGLLVSRLTWGFRSAHSDFAYGAFTLCGPPFQTARLKTQSPLRGPATPTEFPPAVWPRPLSLATTRGITLVLFSSRY